MTEINTNSSQNAFERYKFMNFCNLMKKTGQQKYRIIPKKVDYKTINFTIL